MSVGAVTAAACYGGADHQTGTDDQGDAESGESGTDDSGHEPEGEFGEPAGLGPQGLRRLSNEELAKTLELILHVEREDIEDLIALLPSEAKTPFDNDYRSQTPSGPLIEGMFSLSEDLAERVLGHATARNEVLGCDPSGPDDEACLRSFIESFGRSALRRPLDQAEVDTYARFIDFAASEGDFDVAARLVIQSLLLDGEFLYRIEIGEPVDGQTDVVALDAYEVASRLSFLLWGSGPDAALLDRAQDGELQTPGQIHAAAEGLLQHERGLAQVQRMHAMWLDYEDMPLDPDLSESLRRESDKLVERVLADGHWLGLFTSDRTYLDERLSEHYEIPLPGNDAGWVQYPDVRRGGLLSHGSFLSVGKKFGDTSPVERGKVVWTRILCNEVPPPPATVDTGLPPTGGPANACKPERYNMKDSNECASCHALIDPIGFGLENYGPEGEWRTTEPGRPDCFISGEGELSGVGAFAGAGALGEALVETGQLEGCFMRNFYQFAIGRDPAEDDEAILEELTTTFEEADDLAALLVEFAASEGFRHRVIDTEQ